jgi:hypothetical protein
MQSEHIENSKLCNVVREKAALDQREIDHLRTCLQCLDTIRTIVRRELFAFDQTPDDVAS